MEILQLLLLTVLVSSGFAYPPGRPPLTMEGARRGLVNNFRGAYHNRIFAQAQQTGPVDVCTSVRADNTRGATKDSVVHLCQEGIMQP